MSTQKPTEADKASEPSQSDKLDDEQLNSLSGGTESIWNFHVWNEGVIDPNKVGPSKKKQP